VCYQSMIVTLSAGWLFLLLVNCQITLRTMAFHLPAVPSTASSTSTTAIERMVGRKRRRHRVFVDLSNSDDENSINSNNEEMIPKVSCPNCNKCDGSGRIEGGIGTILTFWPIKAYRPCPNFIENGGFYTRSGQGLDEIAFGRDSKYDPNNDDSYWWMK